MKVFIFILMFFAIAGLILINNHGLHLSNPSELETFSKLYFDWMDKVYSNFFSVTGHVTGLDWIPK